MKGLTSLLAFLPVLVVAAACQSQVSGEGGNEGGAASMGGGGVLRTNGDGGSPSATGGQQTGTGGVVPPSPLDCTEVQLLETSESPEVLDTSTGSNDFEASCFTGGSPDRAIEFIAPTTDYYRISTAGSSFETALALLDETCDGSELACNADPAEPQVELVESIELGQRVVVVVDGKLGASGSAQVDVRPVDCPSLDLSEQAFPISLSTANQGDEFESSCGGAGTPDREMRWKAPSDGLYRFRATAEEFGAIVSLHEGAACGGKEIGCGFTGVDAQAAEVVRRLDEGQVVTLIVDGGGGEFELDVEDITGDADCDGTGDGIVIDGDFFNRNESFASATHLHSGTCSPTGQFNSIAAYAPVGELVFPLAVNLSGDLSCSVNISSDSPFAAYLLRGQDCAGEELECSREATDSFSHSFSFDAAENGQYLLVVEDIDGLGAEFTLSTACVI